MITIVTVLRAGGDFSPAHVQRLHRQFGDIPSICLSDTAVPGVITRPLRSDWPGWFAKMELFDPDQVDGDIFYLDLDTLIVTSPAPYLNDDRLRMLSDFYYPEKPASGVMFIPHRDKARIWRAWTARPDEWMQTCSGDQDVLENICGRGVARFGTGIKSYKAHVACRGMSGWHPRYSTGNGLIPAGTDILCFHGKPRPWDTGPLSMAHRI